MSFTASISLNCGDIIYALPLLRYLYESGHGLATLLICDAHPRYYRRQAVNTYDALKALLMKQEYIGNVERCVYTETGKADFPLDNFIRVPDFDNQHIIKSHFQAQGIDMPSDALRPWLSCHKIKGLEKQGKWMVSASGKFANHGFDFRAYFNMHKLNGNMGEFAFIGLDSEHSRFEALIGQPIEHIKTHDLLEVAACINSCHTFICEQGAPLTIAQGLGVPVLLARDRKRNNCTLKGTIWL